MNYYSVFYWITVADGVKQFFNSASDLFTVLTVVFFVVYLFVIINRSSIVASEGIKNEEAEKINPDYRSWNKVANMFRPVFFTCLGLAVLTWAGYVFTPSKRDALFVVAGGSFAKFITSDSSAKQIPSEVMNLLRVKIRSEIKQINSAGAVEDTLKSKTKEELIEMIQQKK